MKQNFVHCICTGSPHKAALFIQARPTNLLPRHRLLRLAPQNCLCSVFTQAHPTKLPLQCVQSDSPHEAASTQFEIRAHFLKAKNKCRKIYVGNILLHNKFLLKIRAHFLETKSKCRKTSYTFVGNIFLHFCRKHTSGTCRKHCSYTLHVQGEY